MNLLIILIPIIGFGLRFSKLGSIFGFGVVFHEFGHIFFAKLTGLKVFKVNWLGNVEIESTRCAWKAFLICFGPFFINFAVAAAAMYFTIGGPIELIGVFVGTGLFLHASPSKQDLNVLGETLKNVLKGKGDALDYITIICVIALFIASSTGYIAFDMQYMLVIMALMVAFFAMFKSKMLAEFLNLFLFIMIMFIVSGSLSIETVTGFLKQTVDAIYSLFS